MTDTTKSAPMSAGTGSSPSPQKASSGPLMTNEELAAQKDEIEAHRLKIADEQRDVLDEARKGNIQSLEGERPDYEPPIGTKPENPIPSGLVVGGPVLSLEDQAFLARTGKGPEQAPGTKPK